MEVYKRVYIKTADDLPEKEGDYFCCRGGFLTVQRLSRYVPEKSFMREIRWYLLPVHLPSKEEQISYFNNHANCQSPVPGATSYMPTMTRSEVLKFADWLLSKLK